MTPKLSDAAIVAGAEAAFIDPAAGAADLVHVRALFREYQEWLGVDLCFQGFDDELRRLPGRYAPPLGLLLLARVGSAIAGGVGMWPLSETVCEMKRLYVRPPWRGVGLGRRLANAIVAEARNMGFARMRLDTLARLEAARALYASMGFVDIPAYYDNPLDGVLFMELRLAKHA
ncbi:MAG TPA: GNAT family N-acetyltransferase [Rhodospirillales bacterium]|jgi:GNAT superfamily N-acetyltransferase|nr:GNAT family N-acetyltransferase [Rhodospirillales bacterium]HJO68872.1 GNAT family N-acetyltransferase [Rhodospirillales bacterium]